MTNILTERPKDRQNFGWTEIGLAALLLILASIAIWMIGSQVTGGVAEKRQAAAVAAFEEETGIRILRVAMTAAGGMIDLQYQVVDPDKSLIVHDDENPPTLIDDKSGIILATPFHDHNFQELLTATTYHELIMNGDGLLERGSKVTLKVGDSILDHLIVQ